jgi:hypothetical protein
MKKLIVLSQADLKKIMIAQKKQIEHKIDKLRGRVDVLERKRK